MNKTVKFAMQFKNRSGTTGSVNLNYISETADKAVLKSIAETARDKELILIAGEPVSELVGAKLIVTDSEVVI